ncbi:hypothetical protein ACH5RR_041212 [Cinchona calisaya]|uniref:MULE transposase domain-containing protein n=1 Tax=Cinchona calisaya TaxID=153742 RepID=A0ABD2XWW4_9GENT
MDSKKKGKSIDLNEKFVLKQDYFSRNSVPSGVGEVDPLLVDEKYERETVLRMTFGNIEQAVEFYNNYEGCKGFGIRKYNKQFDNDDILVNIIWFGGYENAGFLGKDLYNKIDVERRKEIAIGDAECAIGYLYGKQDSDKTFYYKCDINEEGRVHKLFWADSRSRIDYQKFGEVVVFDTTYRTNEYRKPVVVLVDVNNHFHSVIFGCALLPNESFET